MIDRKMFRHSSLGYMFRLLHWLPQNLILGALAIIGKKLYIGDGNENVTKDYDLIRKTKNLHVRYKFWNISSPYSAKQQREMTKLKALWRREYMTVNLSQLERCSHLFC